MEEIFSQPIPKAERDECELWPLSKHAQNILRHEPQVRGQDEALFFWPISKQNVIEKFSYVQSWNFNTWLEMLSRSSNKMRFFFSKKKKCLDARGEPQYMEVIQGRSGVPEVDPIFFTLLEIPYEWEIHI